jgi:hypothetical protein
LATCHVSASVAVYWGLQHWLPEWTSGGLALVCYWVLRNVIVVGGRTRIRTYFRQLGEVDRSVGKRLSPLLRGAVTLTAFTYADPLGAYDGELDSLEGAAELQQVMQREMDKFNEER